MGYLLIMLSKHMIFLENLFEFCCILSTSELVNLQAECHLWWISMDLCVNPNPFKFYPNMKKILVKLLEAVEVNTDALMFFLLVSYHLLLITAKTRFQV